MQLIDICDLGKRYNKNSDYAVKNINIKGYAGEIIGILGHNGAGKSTIIKCITGLHPYEHGSITIAGYNLAKNPVKAKSHIGYVSDEYTLFETMTGFEYINFMADIYGVKRRDRKMRIEKFQRMLALGEAIYQPISSYSHGMKQKISFMGALIHDPKVFILDEPMVGLDPHTMNSVKNFFVEHSTRGNLVFFSSHNLDVVEKMCDRVYIIDQGVILRELDMQKFRSEGGSLERYFLSITKRVAKI